MNRQVSPYHCVLIPPPPKYFDCRSLFKPFFVSLLNQKYLTEVKAEFKASFLEINTSKFELIILVY